MNAYYLYHLHPNGRFAAREVIQAEDDEKAIALADKASHGDAMELWLGPVRVHTFPARAR